MNASSKMELVHVLVVFRHGDRSPLSRKVEGKLAMDSSDAQFWMEKLPDLSDLQPLNDATQIVRCKQEKLIDTDGQEFPPPKHGGRWPYGQLTKKGIEQMQSRGQQLRHQYESVFMHMDPLQDVYVHSTHIRRTIHSVQSLLSGLFPDYFQQPNGQQFQIHVDSQDTLAPSHPYDLYHDVASIIADDLKRHPPSKLQETSTLVQKILSLNSLRRINWTALREILVCRQAHALEMPKGLTDEIIEQINNIDCWMWYTLYGNKTFCFASYHAGVSWIYSHLTNVLQDNRYKLSLLSAHDNSLVALISALGLHMDPPELPSYGANLCFECYRDPSTNDVYLQVIFEGRAIHFKNYLSSSIVPFSHFQHQVEEFLHQPSTVASL